ncbi:MAG: TrbC/VirB2 family protein [Patescibacteria group bacterium]|jgi:type IV secretory pathway VirB2 component (pilin)
METILNLVDRLRVVAEQVANTLLLPAGGALVVLALIWGGFQYMQGNAESGKKIIIAAIVGLVIMFVASLLIALVNNTLLT